MKISKKEHKVFLWKLFHTLTPQGVYQEKKFPLDKLTDASSCLKKILEDAKRGKTDTVFSDKEQEFDDSEKKLLGELMDDIKEATPSESSIIEELKEILK